MTICDMLDSDLILFGGKGGVGKTTCAAATAMALLPRKTLVVSTDPAHSLGDCLGQAIGDDITGIDQTGNLYALEVSAERTLDGFRQVHGQEMRRLLETSTGIEHLSARERERLLSLPVPGADEVMGLKRLMDIMDEGRFAKYILDTAPTGHTLRLLTMPDVFDGWLKVFYSLREKHRFHEKAFTRPDRADQFLNTLAEGVTRIKDILRSDRTEFVVVAAAERLVIEETKDLIGKLVEFGVRVRHVIVNKLFPDIGSDFARTRRDQEQRLVEEIRKTFSWLEITEVYLQSTEPRGVDNLRHFARLLHGRAADAALAYGET